MKLFHKALLFVAGTLSMELLLIGGTLYLESQSERQAAMASRAREVSRHCGQLARACYTCILTVGMSHALRSTDLLEQSDRSSHQVDENLRALKALTLGDAEDEKLFKQICLQVKTVNALLQSVKDIISEAKRQDDNFSSFGLGRRLKNLVMNDGFAESEKLNNLLQLLANRHRDEMRYQQQSVASRQSMKTVVGGGIKPREKW